MYVFCVARQTASKNWLFENWDSFWEVAGQEDVMRLKQECLQITITHILSADSGDKRDELRMLGEIVDRELAQMAEAGRKQQMGWLSIRSRLQSRLGRLMPKA
jgi:hypothetical protein